MSRHGSATTTQHNKTGVVFLKTRQTSTTEWESVRESGKTIDRTDERQQHPRFVASERKNWDDDFGGKEQEKSSIVSSMMSRIKLY